ncbi:DUF3253 domain-containing protein [Pontivivens ytuae]|uniref:DUF3253 domain-containing protein n=1 Tax=Pontivivens ytuae TaxID=2789856 RepID=A0A7S9LUR1_9RHOB|nr:DUF3253 domain-containing protein [Pontivivens ytuae]QPH55697.1 DUF3253 domain-containing protein [Pontivivens ytuae]
MSEEEIAAAILDLAARREKTFCPSEVARNLSDDWRPLMPEVRAVAARLAEQGQIAVTQKGAPVDAEQARGPIRLARPQNRGRE